jgi:hypothetical protein
MAPFKTAFPANVTKDMSVGSDSQFPVPPHRGGENGVGEVESGLTSSRRYSPTSLSRSKNRCEHTTGLLPEDGRGRLRLVKYDDGGWIEPPRVNR